MCFSRMMQIIKQIFHLSFLYIFIFVFILYISIYIILVPTSDTPINVNNDDNNNNWIYNLSLNKKRETVLPIKSIKDLNIFDIYPTSTNIAIIIMMLIAVLLICYCCRKISSDQDEPANIRYNVEGEYRNDFQMVSFLPDIEYVSKISIVE